MKVFVAGASGAIGRPLLPRLVAAGHEVTGMTRRPERVAEIEAAGAAAVVCDVFEPAALSDVVGAAAPEVVVNLLTSLPERLDPRGRSLGPTNRVRREGTANLIGAAAAAGAKRMVAESVAFMYVPEGGWVKDEEEPFAVGGPGAYGEASAAVSELERQVAEAPGIEGVVLRFGFLYGPGTYYAPGGSQAEDVNKRRFPIVGAGTGTFSFIHVEDAADATAAAVERGGPGAYNVVDDEPAPLHEWLPVYTEALGTKPPRRVPAWLARLVAGAAAAGMATELRGAANAKAKRELAWSPAHPSWRQGFHDALA